MFIHSFYRFFIKHSKRFSRKGIYPFLHEQFAFIPKGAKVLNIGSGGEINQILNQYAQKQSFSVQSMDIDEKRQPDFVGDICNMSFEDNLFDVIVLGEVLEHLHSPHDAIKNIYEALNQKGKCILTVPFIFPIHDRPYDYFRFTRFGLEKLCQEFANVHIRERNNWGEAIYVLFVRHIMENNYGSHLVAVFMMSLGLPFFVILLLLGKLIKVDSITSGYCLVAEK